MENVPDTVTKDPDVAMIRAVREYTNMNMDADENLTERPVSGIRRDGSGWTIEIRVNSEDEIGRYDQYVPADYERCFNYVIQLGGRVVAYQFAKPSAVSGKWVPAA